MEKDKVESMRPNQSPELQQADDLMMLLMEQRNAALNQAAQLGAQLRAAGREIAALKQAQIRPAAEAEKGAPTANGHDPAADAPVAPPSAEAKTARATKLAPAPLRTAKGRKRGRPRKRPVQTVAPEHPTASVSAPAVVEPNDPPADAVPTGGR